jgi:hypothetical protein
MLTTFQVRNNSGNQDKVARREKMPKEKTLASYNCTLLHFEKPRGACGCVPVCVSFRDKFIARVERPGIPQRGDE